MNNAIDIFINKTIKIKNMKTITKILLFALAILTVSCEDIVEEDITNDSVQIISPMNGVVITSNVVNFQWNELEGADKYRVQVYNDDQAIVLDSLVNHYNFTYPMLPGSYQWRVRGENFAYQTEYTFPVNFTLMASEDLATQQVVLSSPSNNYYTNSTSLICTWSPITTADYYELELLNITNGSSTVVDQQSNITTNSVNLTSANLAQEGQYQWKIKAVNDSPSQTLFSTRNFYIDRTNPNQPQNTLPPNNSIQTINQSISLSWTLPTDTGTIQSSLNYVIEFSNDVNFTTIIQSSSSSTNSSSQTFTTPGIYYWRVKAIDVAGNIGVYSSAFKFTIN